MNVIVDLVVDLVVNVMVNVVVNVMVNVTTNSLIYSMSQNQYRFYLYKMRVVKTGRVVLLPIF